jgi:subtilisin family serine protease
MANNESISPLGAMLVVGVAVVISSAGALLRDATADSGDLDVTPPAVVANADAIAADYILVRLADPNQPFAAPGDNARRLAGGPDVETLKSQWSVLMEEPLTPASIVTADRGPQQFGRLAATTTPLSRVVRMRVAPGTDVESMAAAFATSPDVEYAEVDPVGGIATITPDDTYFTWQWSLDNQGQTIAGTTGTTNADINMPEAWALTTGDSAVTVAVLDTGVKADHPELAGRVLAGWNTYEDSSDTSDQHGHGTRVAGIIAASGNNGLGMAGIAWDVYVLPVTVVAADGSGNESHCAAGIIWATDHGADVISMSLQYYGGSQTLKNAVNYAANRGVLLVAATGNDLGNIVAYPARYANCLAVAGTDQRDRWPSYSNYGNEVDLAAPGSNIYSLLLSGASATPASGTSFAAPHVAGAAALMWSYNHSLSAEQVADMLVGTAKDVQAGGWDPKSGSGRLDVLAALTAADPVGDLDCDGYVTFFDIDPFVLTLTDLSGYVASAPNCNSMRADINKDGTVDYFDIDAFIELLVERN